MNPKVKSKTKGFTLVELLVAVVATLVLTLGSGMTLFYTYRNWSSSYTRVYGDVVTDGYVAKRAFGAAVRKSSVSAKEPKVSSDGQALEVYYYNDLTSAKPDRYVKFYTQGSDLLADYGNLDLSTDALLSASRTTTLAHYVKSVKFSVAGTSVRMTLTLDDGTRQLTIVSSALRHSE